MPVILVAGLPGSGKTTHLSGMGNQGWRLFDDFKIGTSKLKFRTSPKFRDLLDAPLRGDKCVVADIDFCDTDARREAECDLRAEVRGLEPSWLFFENDPTACESNIRSRNRECLEGELGYLCKYSSFYKIPDGAVRLAVWGRGASGEPQMARRNSS